MAQGILDPSVINEILIDKMFVSYAQQGNDIVNEIQFKENGPTILLVVGVNGVGKTTTIAKLAYRYQKKGKKVLLVAGDTFRAGAIEQLAVWAERIKVDIVTHPANSDPSSVMYDAIKKATSEGYDILLCDTAGRLQTKVNLMNELSKMKRVLQTFMPDAPHETLLVVDATTGQNGMSQAKAFKEATDVSGIILTKLDGTSKGGIVLAIRHEMGIPIKYIGLGEAVDDLEVFDIESYLYGLFADFFED
jgi:fused signal recognition particle receptor